MKKEFIFQKFFGAILIILGIIPFLMLSANAFHTMGMAQVVVSFRTLLQIEGAFGLWGLIGLIYWLSFFIGALIIALGLILCIMRTNLFLEKRKIGLAISIVICSFYLFALIANIVMIGRNGAYFTFYIYSFSKILAGATIALAYILAQKSNKKSKKQENKKW